MWLVRGARVHAGDAGDAAGAQPCIEPLGGAPVAGLGDVLFHHQAAGGDGEGFDVLGIGADIADMGEGEADHLAGVGRVRQGFLVAGHAGVEADLAQALAIGAGCFRGGMGAEATAPEDVAVGQDKGRGGAGRDGRIHMGAAWVGAAHMAARNKGAAHMGAPHMGAPCPGFGLELAEAEAGGGEDGRPVLAWNGAGLAPFANGFPAYTG